MYKCSWYIRRQRIACLEDLFNHKLSVPVGIGGAQGVVLFDLLVGFGGVYRGRRGEYKAFHPRSCHSLQAANPNSRTPNDQSLELTGGL